MSSIYAESSDTTCEGPDDRHRSAVSKPLVTVVTPCFNVAPFLGATLRSVQTQTLRDFEVILVDDGSTDDTLSIMRQFSSTDARFKVVALERNQGVVAARNVAMAQARGEFIAMLDGDDIWTRDALALRVELVRRYPSADVIATDFAWFEDELPDLPTGRVGLGASCPSGVRQLVCHG